MKILAVGGGSGGHVTPIAAVIKSLEHQNSSHEIRMWCDGVFAEQAREIVAAASPNTRVDVILAGKFRRYHDIPLYRQLLRFNDVVLPNIVDAFKIIGGFLQCFVKLIIWRPNVVFCKGGFVCLPAGLAAFVLRIPIVLHDSDAHPGLTNRILSRVATYIATGATLDNYNYPIDRASYVGIPISENLRKFSSKEIAGLKKSFNFKADKPLVVVTGGGLGAVPINQTVVKIASELVKDVNIILITGTYQYEEVKKDLADVSEDSLRIYDFVSEDFISIQGAADVVVTRAGATTLLELAALAKPVILIPNPNLTGGHQTKNAKYYESKNACVVLSEKAMLQDASVLLDAVRSLIADPHRQTELSRNIHQLAMPHAADDVAALLKKAAHVQKKDINENL